MNAQMLKYHLLWVIVFIIACSTEDVVKIKVLPLEIAPTGLGDTNVPDDNSYTDLRWQLGKKMFYDIAFSRDSSISCASCHKQEYAFGDNLPTTNGAFGRAGTRNVPSIANVIFYPYFLREGGLNTLEKQVLVPIQEHNEFDLKMPELLERLKENSTYVKLSKEAYGRELDPFVITRAISVFERSIVSYRSKYDLHLAGDENILSVAEKRGYNLFTSDRLACFKCHSGPLFSNFGFENNGIYEEYSDLGKFRLTGIESDKGRFKVPSLRNIGFTAPYMHDGSIATLDKVIEHYNSGGKIHPNKSALIKAINLTNSEKADLKAFLLTLNDNDLIEDVRYKK
jgi:cytochrome c peroxidase